MNRFFTGLVFLALLASVAIVAPGPIAAGSERSDDRSAIADANATSEPAYGEDLGTVRFPTSCDEAVQSRLERGLALLHHMTYEGSRAAFERTADGDPECAMAYWGQAMTYIHPLWSDPPTEEQFARGVALLEEAGSRAEKDSREEAYIDAARAYYAQEWSRAEAENIAAFEKGWESVHERFPDDPEAALFYALAHLATADPADKTYAKQRRSGAIAERILDEIPDHPGGHHYAIHSYDYPALAEKALEIARNYGDIAPAVPHALHMPSHIFTRLGLWEESIAFNRRSAEAALEHPVDGKVSLHYLHALDYLAYAHLQRGERGEAEEVLKTMRELEGPFQIDIATPYTLAAVPARLALEDQRWSEAAQLEPRTPSEYPWDKFPALEATTHFARALGAARSGDRELAGASIDRLATLRDRAAETSDYWADQVEIQRLAATAWLELAEGEEEEALTTMRAAAEMETATEKHPVTPGAVLPAQELLGDMLRELGRHEEAVAAYEAALERSPRRLNSLYGAGRAAELAGDATTASSYYDRLVDTVAADTDDPEVERARDFLAASRSGR